MEFCGDAAIVELVHSTSKVSTMVYVRMRSLLFFSCLGLGNIILGAATFTVKNSMITDDFGRYRFFHGVNAVEKSNIIVLSLSSLFQVSTPVVRSTVHGEPFPAAETDSHHGGTAARRAAPQSALKTYDVICVYRPPGRRTVVGYSG